VTTRAFSGQLAVTAPAALAGVLAEAMACAVRQASIADAAACVLWTLGLWAVPAALSALLLAWLLASACDDQACWWKVGELWQRPPSRDALLLGLVGSSLLGAVVFVGARQVTRFHNQELAAALLAVSTLGAGLSLGQVCFASWRALRRRGRPRTLRAGSLALSIGVWLWIGIECGSGLRQLDPRLAAGPLSFVLVLSLADRSRRWRALGRPIGTATLAVFLLATVGLFAAPARAGALLAIHGPWSRPWIAALQQLSDFDRDGYSSWLGGGDCEPFDPSINPGAAEVAGDGVDNNCIGGDAGKASAPRRPIWGPSAHGSPANLNLVIVTVETLRRDHASFIGSVHDTTPNLRELAASSLVFERMYSAAPYTRLALASLFSSYAPSEIDWQLRAPEKHMRHIAPSTPWLPELLAARGYETIAVLTDFSAFTPQEDVGFERGFRHYDVSTQLEYRGGTMWGFPAAAQVDKAIGYVAQAAPPFMLWLHFFEPHYRYEQPPGAPRFGADEQSRYDAEIWHVDQQIGRLIDGLRRLGRWDSTVLFVTGDHGEAFGEHDDRWHGTNLFDPQLRPAALLRVPGVTGKRLDVSVTFTDLAPTFARLLGDRQTFDQLRGRSLAPLMHHRTLPDGEGSFISETFNIEDGRAYQAALVAYPLKLIYAEHGHRFTLFDLAADPRELRPLDPGSDPRSGPLSRELVAYLERARPRALSPR
jgi:arylsulfatase A-like enzyme